MPFYEYECSHCRYYVEALQKLSDAPLRKCPSCGKASLKKLISAPVFRLKGSGWYETDFKTDNKRNLAGGEREAANDGGAAAADAKESKAETKAESKAESKGEAKGTDGPAAPPAKAVPAADSASASKPSSPGATETGARRVRASIRGKAKAAVKRPAAPGRAGSRAKSTRRPGRR